MVEAREHRRATAERGLVTGPQALVDVEAALMVDYADEISGLEKQLSLLTTSKERESRN